MALLHRQGDTPYIHQAGSKESLLKSVANHPQQRCGICGDELGGWLKTVIHQRDTSASPEFQYMCTGWSGIALSIDYAGKERLEIESANICLVGGTQVQVFLDIWNDLQTGDGFKERCQLLCPQALIPTPAERRVALDNLAAENFPSVEAFFEKLIGIFDAEVCPTHLEFDKVALEFLDKVELDRTNQQNEELLATGDCDGSKNLQLAKRLAGVLAILEFCISKDEQFKPIISKDIVLCALAFIEGYSSVISSIFDDAVQQKILQMNPPAANNNNNIEVMTAEEIQHDAMKKVMLFRNKEYTASDLRRGGPIPTRKMTVKEVNILLGKMVTKGLMTKDNTNPKSKFIKISPELLPEEVLTSIKLTKQEYEEKCWSQLPNN